MSSYALTLKTNGVVVIPVSVSLIDQRNRFILSQHPEFNSINPDLFVMGNFGALGHPSSFHHPAIREIRKTVHDELVDFWKVYSEGTTKKLEILFDRFSIRKPGTKVSAESWHRDICNIKIDGDSIFGGWINLDSPDSEPQIFSCVPKTHMDRSDDEGFAKIDKEQGKIYSGRKIRYKIPPGHIIIFSQNIVHEVVSKAYKTETYKLYIGWRVTDEADPLFKENLEEGISKQAIVKIPSGQYPAMFTKNHRRFFAGKVKDFSNLLIPKYLDKEGYVKQYMESLKDSELPLYTEYSEEDINILTPHRL